MEEELELLNQGVELLFRGKHVVAARTLAEFAAQAQRIPGLGESAERVVDFFEDPQNGNWVDGSALYRVLRADQSNRLKRLWRDFEHRRSTLREYIARNQTAATSDLLRFRIPEERLRTPKAFIVAFRHVVGRLDQLCRGIGGDGFSIEAVHDPAGCIVLRPESGDALDISTQMLQHFRWYRAQAEDVRQLEARRAISEEYAKAARSLAAAQGRHLHTMLETTVEEHVSRSDERFQSLVSMAAEYIEVLIAYAAEGAEVYTPAPVDIARLAS